MNKTEIRTLALAARNSISRDRQQQSSRQVLTRLEEMALFKKSSVILAYFGHHGEIETKEFLERWLKEKAFLLPRLEGENEFIALPVNSLEDLEPNRFGIPEPKLTQQPSPKAELILVPGVAFDRAGNRIGMGKGYYDRFLKEYKNVPRVALAYREQVLESLPKDPYDEPVDWIITEDEVIRCQS